MKKNAMMPETDNNRVAIALNNRNQQTLNPDLPPERIQEKADILETNLFKTLSNQTDPYCLTLKINRAAAPDIVILKAFSQLMPRLQISPREHIQGLKNLFKKNASSKKIETLTGTIQEPDEIFYDALPLDARNLEASVSETEVILVIKGIPEKKSIHGKIARSFFDHEQSPGKLLNDGMINFKEINRYPIVAAGDRLFYITHEQQGEQGITYDGKVTPVEEAMPFQIDIGPGVEKIDDLDDNGISRGYFLQALKTGVIILDRDEHQVINGIGISEEIEAKKLDYSTGNIGSHYTCPIQMKIGVICNGFSIRVNGKVEATIVDGGKIITNDTAIITKAQAQSSITALKDITIDSAARSKIVSENGTITVNRELIDSNLSASKIIFKKKRGLITNNILETENLSLTDLYFSAENIIRFGASLFERKEEMTKALDAIEEDKLQLKDTQKTSMEKLQAGLKRMTKLTIADRDLVKHIKPLIMATNTMDYAIIHREMDQIEKKNHTRVVATVRSLFETLEKIPKTMKAFADEELRLNKDIHKINHRMASMTLSIEGVIKQAAIIKIYCGLSGCQKGATPDFIVDAKDSDNRQIKVTGTYSLQKGFEFIQ